ncbi:hypothetical protein [Candidatus Nephthysia bennettiae]|uniref:hypothetical protein n=1 Tax=Candidatus Nephthysia bennettiae TaxID=3127016 RepID=UPI00331306D4
MGSIDEAVTAERAGCDFIIAQGIEAGGHICGTLGLLPLLSQILNRVIRVPVPAARHLAAPAAARASWWPPSQRLIPPTSGQSSRPGGRGTHRPVPVGCLLCPSNHGVLGSAIQAARRSAVMLSANSSLRARRWPSRSSREFQLRSKG